MRQRTTILVNLFSSHAIVTADIMANLFVVGYLTRSLSGESFGLVILALSLPAIFQLLGSSLSKGIVRHVAVAHENNNSNELSSMMTASLLMFLILGLVASAAALGLSQFPDILFDTPENLRNDARLSFIVVSVGTLVCFPFNTYQGMLFAIQKHYWVNLSRIGPICLRAALIPIWFITWGPSVSGVVVIAFGCRFIERLSWWFLARRFFSNAKFLLNGGVRNSLVALLAFSTAAVLVDIGNILGYEGYKFVVGKTLSLHDVGLYGLYAMLASYALVFSRTAANVLMPVATKHDACGKKDGNEFLLYAGTKTVMALSGLFCIVSTPFLKQFLELWASDRIGGAENWSIAAVLLIGQYGSAIGVCSGVLLTGVGRQHYMAVVALTCYSVAFCVSYVVLQWFFPTLLVAAIIISVFRILNNTLRFKYSLRFLAGKRKGILFDAVARPTFVAIATLPTSWLLSELAYGNGISLFLIAITVVFVTYLLAMFAFGLCPSERRQIADLVRQKTEFLSNAVSLERSDK